MIGKAPSAKMVERMKSALNCASAKQDDKAKAIQIWRDFRWRLKTSADGYQAIRALADEFAIRAKTELLSAEVRDQVVAAFERVSDMAAEGANPGQETKV